MDRHAGCADDEKGTADLSGRRRITASGRVMPHLAPPQKNFSTPPFTISRARLAAISI